MPRKPNRLPAHAQLVLVSQPGVLCDGCRQPVVPTGCLVASEVLAKADLALGGSDGLESVHAFELRCHAPG